MRRAIVAVVAMLGLATAARAEDQPSFVGAQACAGCHAAQAAAWQPSHHALAMQHLDLFELTPPFYYFAPHRVVNRDHARAYPLYDHLRRRFGCDSNLDLNRLARSTSSAGRRTNFGSASRSCVVQPGS